jgi:hypothetical protein
MTLACAHKARLEGSAGQPVAGCYRRRLIPAHLLPPAETSREYRTDHESVIAI